MVHHPRLRMHGHLGRWLVEDWTAEHDILQPFGGIVACDASHVTDASRNGVARGGRMTSLRRLPRDLAALVAASLLVESEPGVFRSATALHTARLPSRAEVYHDDDAAAPKNLRPPQTDPRRRQVPPSPGPETIRAVDAR